MLQADLTQVHRRTLSLLTGLGFMGLAFGYLLVRVLWPTRCLSGARWLRWGTQGNFGTRRAAPQRFRFISPLCGKIKQHITALGIIRPCSRENIILRVVLVDLGQPQGP